MGELLYDVPARPGFAPLEGIIPRTIDLCRVNLEVRTLKPVFHLAFPHFSALENAPKQLGFDGELMASFLPPRVLKRSGIGGEIGIFRQ